MRSKSFIAVSAFILVLLAASVGVYAYDAGRDDRIADGITIGGVDVGGLEAAAAEARLRAALLEPLEAPVVARYKGKRFKLDPAKAQVGVNVDASVDEALRRSREGSIVTRTVRGLTGGEVRAAMDVEVTYDEDAVRRVVRRARKAIDAEPVDAEVSFEGGQITRSDHETGRKVVAAKLRRQLARRLTSTTASRTVRIRTKTLEPEVTTADLAEKYPTVIIVNRGGFSLQLYKDLEPAKSYRVAVGKAGLETPQGLYTIQNKAVNPTWNVPQSDWAGELAGTVVPPGPSNPLKARWMGIYNGAGIHGTDAIGSLGTAASHGCIRMAVPDVVDLYDQVDVGTPVYIL